MEPVKKKKAKAKETKAQEFKDKGIKAAALKKVLKDVTPEFRLKELQKMYREIPEYRDFIKAVYLFNVLKLSKDIRSDIQKSGLDEEEHLVSDPKQENRYIYSLAGRNDLIGLVDKLAEKTEQALYDATQYPVNGEKDFPIIQDVHLLKDGNPGSRNNVSSDSYRKIIKKLGEKWHSQFTGIFEEIILAFRHKPFDYSFDTEKFILICSETKYNHIPDVPYNYPFRDSMLNYAEGAIKRIKVFNKPGSKKDDYTRVLEYKLLKGGLDKYYISGKTKSTEYARLNRGMILMSFIIWGTPDIFSALDKILENKNKRVSRTEIPVSVEPNMN